MDFIVLALDAIWPWRVPPLKKMSLDPGSREQNPLMMQFYTWESRGNDQTSWWKHFEQEVPRLKDLGVTHVWLPPMSKSATKDSVGYDIYDLWDLGEFDQKGMVKTRWGTKQELLKACSVARSHGIGIIVDTVLNHKVGGDEKETFQAVPIEEKNRLNRKGPPREIEDWTAYNFVGRGNKHNEMEPSALLRHASILSGDNQEKLTLREGVDYDSRTKTKGIFYIPGRGRRGWSKYVANELGNYDFLFACDVDHRQPEVRNDLFAWGSWILEQTGAVGFRMDAMKHYDRRFLREFLERTKKAQKKPDLFAVSEFWSGDINILETYVDLLRGSTTFFDVPLHFNLHNASKQGPKWDLRNILNETLVGRMPWDAVTFVDNHDTQIGQSLESWVYPGFKLQAYGLILLRTDGFPCIFYGDLYPDNECYDPRIGPKLEALIQARKKFAYGSTTDYFRYRDCIGFVRSGDARHAGCAVVLRSSIALGEAMAEPASSDEPRTNGAESNTSDEHGEEIRMKIPVPANKKQEEEVKYRDLLGGYMASIAVSFDGWATFPCPEGSIAVWVAESSLDTPSGEA